MNGWERPNLGAALLRLAVATLTAGLFLRLLWNWFVPGATGWRPIGYATAIGLVALLALVRYRQ